MKIQRSYFKRTQKTPKPRTEKKRKNLEKEAKKIQNSEEEDKPDWWDSDVGRAIRQEERQSQISERKKNLLLKRAVLMSEIGLSFQGLTELTPKEQNDLIEGWNILQEEKEQEIDEPDI